MNGLTTLEAQERIKKYGANTMPEEKYNIFLVLLQKFWAPIPWMLEMIILLEAALGKWTEAWIIAFLLVFNAVLSFFQESRAKKALFLLKNQLNVQARVLRDGEWRLLAASELVPDDIIRVRMGDIVPADIEIVSGHLLIDQSALTGESIPIEAAPGKTGYAGSIVKHGEAFAKVSATGKNTFFGTTAELIKEAKTPSHLQQTIFQIIKYLIIFDLILVFFIFIYSVYEKFSLIEMIPFALLLLVASVPVALPAMYTLSTALGSLELAKIGVLVTRLTAIEEAAAMTILCVDKTGTITQNRLEISSLLSYAPYTKDDLIVLGALACEESTQDPIDLAILKKREQSRSSFTASERIKFIPFDPENKYSEALIVFSNQRLRILKGAPSTLAKIINKNGDFSRDVEKIAADGSRVLAVVVGEEMAGLIGLQDPPREDSKEALEEIRGLGVKVIMLTGDSPATAQSIACQVGIGPKVLSREDIPKSQILDCDIIAGVFPEDKFHLITLLQKNGAVCGMTGDGVNDAPALKKADVGIAVSNATDVAKASASLVMTRPGLEDVIEAIKTSRKIYQRMLTYTFNKIIKTLEISILLGIGLIITHQLIISQLLIVLLLFANDFMTMSIAMDNVSYSQKPDHWNVRKMTFVGCLFAALILGFSFFVLLFGEKHLLLPLPEIQTLVFLTLVFTGQATVYLVRERGHFWHSMPSPWMMASSILDVTVLCIFAVAGILMAPLKASLVLGLLAGIIVYFVLMDFIKVIIFKKIKLR